MADLPEETKLTMLQNSVITGFYVSNYNRTYKDKEIEIETPLYACIPLAKKQKMLQDVAKTCKTTKYECRHRTSFAGTEHEISVAANMVATATKRCARFPKGMSSCASAAQDALWAVCEVVPRLGITHRARKSRYLTDTPPNNPPALSTWWDRTTEPDRVDRLRHYRDVGNPHLTPLVQALEQSLEM